MYLWTCKTPARLEPVGSPNDKLAAGLATSRTSLPCPAVSHVCGTNGLRRRHRPACGLAVRRRKLAVLDNWRGWGLRNNLGDMGLSPAAIATQMSGVGGMARIDDINPHGQRLVACTDRRGNHRYARVWGLECSSCGERYGANSCDFHIRRCPRCQRGKPGLSLESTSEVRR